LAVKVLIEQVVKAGYEELVWEMLRDLRGQAVRQRGYLYGETWRSLDNPRVFLVASTWGSREYLEA
jgi:heme-degrading monooxygenase HmoA